MRDVLEDLIPIAIGLLVFVLCLGAWAEWRDGYGLAAMAIATPSCLLILTVQTGLLALRNSVRKRTGRRGV